VILAPPPPPARVQVVAQEFRYGLSRQTIKAGWAVVELRNGGEDTHDLRMRRIGGTRIYAWPNVRAGDVVDRTFKLLPGRYALWCSVANHRALGMRATLVVVRR
jgi:plastocyanin